MILMVVMVVVVMMVMMVMVIMTTVVELRPLVYQSLTGGLVEMMVVVVYLLSSNYSCDTNDTAKRAQFHSEM